MERETGQVLDFIMETEATAEDILADRQQIVDLDRRRQKTREARRSLQKQGARSDKQWVCFGGMFLKLPHEQTKKLLDKDFDQLDSEIESVRQKLKVKVNKLRDLENKDSIKGFGLTPLSKEEMKAVSAVL